MIFRRFVFTAFVLATTVAMRACNYCGAEEEHAFTISSGDSLTLVRDGVSRKIQFVTRVSEPEISPASFQFVFNTIEGASNGEGIALTLSGPDHATNQLVMLSLALPVSLRKGEEYQVGATFTVDPGLSADPRMFGAHNLQQADRAEAAFVVATYTFPPPLYTTDFRAVASSGTVRVTERQRGWIELALNLIFTDASGKTTAVTGRAQATSEGYTPPCT